MRGRPPLKVINTGSYPETDDDGIPDVLVSPTLLGELEDLKPRVASNLFFLLGAIGYILSSVTDLEEAEADPLGGIEQSYYDDLIYIKSELDMATLFEAFGAFCFFLCASTDFYEYANKSVSLFDPEIVWDVLASLAFGSGAIMDLTLCFIVNNDDHFLEKAGIISAHFYLLSAVFSLIEYRVRRCCPLPIAMRLFGDFLFLIGSLIDCTISYMSHPLIFRVDEEQISFWELVSAVLWFTNAASYLVTDMTVEHFNPESSITCPDVIMCVNKNDLVSSLAIGYELEPEYYSFSGESRTLV